MTTATIHLMGGGRGGFFALRRQLKLALLGTGKPHPKVAYIGAASGDSAVFFAMVRVALGGAMRLVRTVASGSSSREAREVLEESDLVFFSGGDVEQGMRVLAERGLVEPLQRLAGGGKPMFGVSAGAIMLARDWVRFPDGREPELFDCLGVAPVHVDAHGEADDWDELRTLVDLLRRRGDAQPVGHGLTNGGGLRVEVSGANVTLAAIGTPIPRLGVKGDQVVHLAPLEP